MALTGTMGIWSWMRTFPEGLMRLPLPRALTTSSADRLCDKSARGSTLTTRVRWLPPKGGGAETPGRLANMGRTLNRAWSWMSPMLRVGLDSTR
jgi:hypothetical protein